MSQDSQFFPKHPPSVEDHHNVLHRHARVIGSHTNQLIEANERFKKIEEHEPMTQLAELEKDFLERFAKLQIGFQEEIGKIRNEVTKVRTTMWIIGILLSGGYVSGKAIEVVHPPQPIIVEVKAK